VKKVLVIVGNSRMITSPGLGIEVMDKVSPDVAIVKDNPSLSV
jgi:hypothetical protein